VVELVEDANTTEKQEEVQPEAETQETPVLEEITEEEVKEQVDDLAEQAQEAMLESAETGKALPENLQKVVDFMEETGGTLEDYVRLNQDFSSYDDMTVLREYYKQTKSHLTDDEISFFNRRLIFIR
jgi:Zn-dependent oligopeptidase